MNPKEELSLHVEEKFKQCIAPGLHVLDFATGSGKSYTLGKLTCEYYPDHFDRIIILCVQNKLEHAISRDIDDFIDSPKSLLDPDDKLVVENNLETLKKAVCDPDEPFRILLAEMDRQCSKLSSDEEYTYPLRKKQEEVSKQYDCVMSLMKIYNEHPTDELLKLQLELELNLRIAVRAYFSVYKKFYEETKTTGNYKRRITLDVLIRLFPSLPKIYPQVAFSQKRVIIMTVHKAMYGIDPIVKEAITFDNLSEGVGKTLVLFDESDQAIQAMRGCIIEQSLNNNLGQMKYMKGYSGLLYYNNLLDTNKHITSRYSARLPETLIKAKSYIDRRWKYVFGNQEPYKNIFLSSDEKMENYRRGIFFCGDVIKLNITPRGQADLHTYICHHPSARDFVLVHSPHPQELQKQYDLVVPLTTFLSHAHAGISLIQSMFSGVIQESFRLRREAFNEELNNMSKGEPSARLNYLAYPTLDREAYTFFSRFETPSEAQFKHQQMEFMTNRKNITTSAGASSYRYPDYSFYSQGVRLYMEEVDEKDALHRVRLSCREIVTTAEKMIVDLAQREGVSVVFCSATASSRSVVSNADFEYISEVLGRRLHFLSPADHERHNKLLDMTYPQSHKIDVQGIYRFVYEDMRENQIFFPEKYKKMFSPEAQALDLPQKWFFNVRRRLIKQASKADGVNMESVVFGLNRFYQFIEAYHWFITHGDIHSMIYFQNRTGFQDSVDFNVLACLIDGSFKNQPSELEYELPSDWKNDHLFITAAWEDVANDILPRLSEDKGAKLMLIAAYGSFKVGANMQYKVPDGIECLSGDFWASDCADLKKDWDAVYLQAPTGYLTIDESGNHIEYEKSLYNAMVVLMMFYERAFIDKAAVSGWLYRALTRNFLFGAQEAGIMKDKSAWMQTIIEQAVGRICRTKVKPSTTYILYDAAIEEFFQILPPTKSSTKEYRALVNHVSHTANERESGVNLEEIIRCNEANKVNRTLVQYLKNALRYTVHKGYYDAFSDEPVPPTVTGCQMLLQNFKQIILKKPVVSSLSELSEESQYIPFLSECYGSWLLPSSDEYTYAMDNKAQICALAKGRIHTMSAEKVRLDVMMKNDCIRRHFENNGFATSWTPGGLILHPFILGSFYAGEIGEEAFLAIFNQYVATERVRIQHLTGKEYELADFVVTDTEGNYIIAIDVKNLNPFAQHLDRLSDMTTTEKRQEKCDRLGVSLITVNVLEIKATGVDALREINGIIDDRGKVIHTAIEQLKKLIGE